MSKIKILNDPVYGFIRLPRDIVFELMEHPYFQRLRRIKQLGMTHLVYPGAYHTRFHHALGAFYLMSLAVDTLNAKGAKITDEECIGASIAILLHDIGHGPFSHALEEVVVEGVSHEELSTLFMERLNEQFPGKLDLALEIFKGTYPRKFLQQLVASQLDLDRLDYLRRDSFYTGVSEGVVGSDRIIKMMTVKNDELAIEAKGIYSIEKFLMARRLMYWQVYLHKTVLSAEEMLIKILKRAKQLAREGVELFATPPFRFFLYEQINKTDFRTNSQVLDTFALLDDYDIMASVKTWTQHSDIVLSTLCNKMINRDLYKLSFQKEPFDPAIIDKLKQRVVEKYKISYEDAGYFVFSDRVENRTYSSGSININILMKDGSVKDISEASDQYDLPTLSRNVVKYFICRPKDINDLTVEE